MSQSPYHYPWPASALTPEDMRLLHDTREQDPQHTPITRLIAAAVREKYDAPEQSGLIHGEESLPCAA